MTIVRTQGELDKALRDGVSEIEVDSPAGVWLEISKSGSATVRAYGSATVRASGSATVRAYGSATVHASGSATVRASGSATVHAYGSATVHAYGSATVHAYDSATVHASKYVAIHLHSQRVQLDGEGHVIDVTGLDHNDPATWCEYRGIEVVNGVAFVFKAVGDDWKSASYNGGGFTSYAPGEMPEAADWSATRVCGQGLHFSPSPIHAMAFRDDATRFLKCGVRLDEMVTLDVKVKARRVVVGCVEVDLHGVEVTA